MRTIDELGISNTPWYERVRFDVNELVSTDEDGHTQVVFAWTNDVINKRTPNNARLIAAAPELLVFAVAYYNANKKNAVKINPNNGDKFQSGLMLMCKEALVKAGIMEKDEVWQEDVK